MMHWIHDRQAWQLSEYTRWQHISACESNTVSFHRLPYTPGNDIDVGNALDTAQAYYTWMLAAVVCRKIDHAQIAITAPINYCYCTSPHHAGLQV